MPSRHIPQANKTLQRTAQLAADLSVGRHADDAILSLATQGASARPEPVLFLGTRAFVHGDVDNCLERSAP